MSERLRGAGFTPVGYDLDPQRSATTSLEGLVDAVPPPRIMWTMVPAGDAVGETVASLAGLLGPGDVVVDGGNSRFQDSIRHATLLGDRGVHFADVGTSGGVWGLSDGYCLMVGGTDEVFGIIEPLLAALSTENGYAHVGPVGAGHFVKMIHNSIEYGLLQAYGEGFELLESSRVYPELDLGQIAALWGQGSVIRSWILELAEMALGRDPALTGIADHVDDSGYGRWAVQAAIEQEVPAPLTALALFSRFASRQDSSFALKLVAALRHEFGGHNVHRD